MLVLNFKLNRIYVSILLDIVIFREGFTFFLHKCVSADIYPFRMILIEIASEIEYFLFNPVNEFILIHA